MKLLSSLRLAWLRIKNPLDYSLRQHLHPGVRPVDHPRISMPDLAGRYKAGRREQAGQEIQRLTELYHFDYFSTARTLDEARENFFYLAMVDRALDESFIALPDSLSVADIGPSSWFYVHALFAALTWYNTWYPRSVHLTGFEVDPYRLYSDLHTRQDHALGNMRGLPNVEYIGRGIMPQGEPFDIITLFFPFVFIKDHLEWGLPPKLFDPESMLKLVYETLKPGGLILIVNQGGYEHKEQLKILEKCGFKPTAAFRMESMLYTYKLDRFVITVKK
ncbi:MAG: hypothetical protein GX577_12395 [Leptolinea sp.]|nr:hypothetical protein [Leptolinea sp.]